MAGPSSPNNLRTSSEFWETKSVEARRLLPLIAIALSGTSSIESSDCGSVRGEEGSVSMLEPLSEKVLSFVEVGGD